MREINTPRLLDQVLQAVANLAVSNISTPKNILDQVENSVALQQKVKPKRGRPIKVVKHVRDAITYCLKAGVLKERSGRVVFTVVPSTTTLDMCSPVKCVPHPSQINHKPIKPVELAVKSKIKKETVAFAKSGKGDLVPGKSCNKSGKVSVKIAKKPKIVNRQSRRSQLRNRSRLGRHKDH